MLWQKAVSKVSTTLTQAACSIQQLCILDVEWTMWQGSRVPRHMGVDPLAISAFGMLHLCWDIDTGDWQDLVTDNTRPGYHWADSVLQEQVLYEFQCSYEPTSMSMQIGHSLFPGLQRVGHTTKEAVSRHPSMSEKSKSQKLALDWWVLLDGWKLSQYLCTAFHASFTISSLFSIIWSISTSLGLDDRELTM